MAKAAARAKGRGGGRKAPVAASSGGMFSGGNRMLILFTGIALVPFSLPTLMVLACGMLPTMGAAIAPRRVGGNAWVAVCGLNFAGIFPWVLYLWMGHHTIPDAIQEITSVFPLLVAWAAAAAGWLLHLMMGPIVASWMAYTSQRMISQLVSAQRRLVEVWGEEVITRELPTEEGMGPPP